MEVGGLLPAVQHDQLVVIGNATFGGAVVLNMINGFLPKAGDSFDLFEIGGTLSGGFVRTEFIGIAPGFEYSVALRDGEYRLTALNDAQPVPEPATLTSISLGALIAALFVWRRRWRRET
jgi:hypothetical protein